MSSRIVLELKPGKDNPRNSEGAFITLASGRILFIFTRYYGDSSLDHAPAVLAARWSDDAGRTWSDDDRVIVENEGQCNVMSVSLLRLQDGRIALFYLLKNGLHDCRTWMRTSSDEAETWSQPMLTIPPLGYFVTNNDRVIQLKSGRIIVPAALHRHYAIEDGDHTENRMDGRGIAMYFLSDDAGETWREAADWWALPVRSKSGLQEPGAVELKGGRVYGFCRTDQGKQWELLSRDKGVTWSPPKASRFQSPNSPLSIKRIPSTGDLLAVWNDHSPKWMKQYKKAAGWRRYPHALALSKDEGKTWRHNKLVETSSGRGYCYTAIHFTDDDHVLLAYCAGKWNPGCLTETRVRRLSMDFVYG